MVKKGKVPASYLCWLIGVQNWRYKPIAGVMSVTMLCVFLMVFLPNICRYFFTDSPAFGKTESAKLVLGFTLVGTLFPIMLLFNYNVNCSLEMGFRYKASCFLKNLLLPEGALVDNGHDKSSNDYESTTVRLSLSRACNTVAWGACRELMHGASFCPFMHSKANAYVACSFGAAIGVSSIASFGGLILGTGEAELWVTLPGVIKSLFFSTALAIFVLLAYRVNFSTRYQRLEISKARLVVLAEIAELERLEQLNDENSDNSISIELAELRTSSELLQVVDKQTTVSDHANPVRAMGLVADPAVLSVIISILFATLYLEIQKLATGFIPPGTADSSLVTVVPSPSSSQ
jgi:hypothetical protein